MSAQPLVELAGGRAALAGEAIAIHWLGPVAAVATGEAEVALLDRRGAVVKTITDLHSGALLAAAPGPDGGLLTAGDDGQLNLIAPDGAARALARLAGGWIDAIAYAPATGMMAAAIGKEAVLLDRAGAEIHRFDHPARVAGLAFDPSGRRLACAHYGGATLSWASNPASRRKTLDWKGAHLDVRWSPDARFLLTTMMENTLHGWRLQDGSHFRMAGYPGKIRSLSFNADGRWLATAGAPEIVCWPFAGATGPVGKEGMVAGALSAPVTVVACHPSRPVVAAGAADGEIVICPLGQGPRPVLVDGPNGAAAAALAWSADGAGLAFARADGSAGVIDLAAHL